MALHGKFAINDAEFSPLTFPGIGTFMAFSGDGIYRNHGACAMIPKMGPIPAGKYWIVDRPIDDYTWVEGVRRGNFRLHPGVLSDGCVTLHYDSDFAVIRNALLRTPMMDVPCMKKLKAYGTIEVITNGKACP